MNPPLSQLLFVGTQPPLSSVWWPSEFRVFQTSLLSNYPNVRKCPQSVKIMWIVLIHWNQLQVLQFSCYEVAIFHKCRNDLALQYSYNQWLLYSRRNYKVLHTGRDGQLQKGTSMNKTHGTVMKNGVLWYESKSYTTTTTWTVHISLNLKLMIVSKPTASNITSILYVIANT